MLGHSSVLVFAEKYPSSKSQATGHKMPKEEKTAIQKENQAKRNLQYQYSCRVKFSYIAIYTFLLLSIIIVVTHLKIKAGFGV